MAGSFPLSWLDGSGPDSGIVVSSRVRLARNVAGIRFCGRNGPDERDTVARLVEEAAGGLPQFRNSEWFQLDRLDPVTRKGLAESQQIPNALAVPVATSNAAAGAVLGVGDGVSILVNEEDHLRIQSLRSGMDMEAAWRAAVLADVGLGRRICFAFHPRFGYLTSCPTNVGTGLRASVLLHLPGLVRAGEFARMIAGIERIGLVCRGAEGEGSEARGGLFQISNQVTLGRDEGDLVALLDRVVREFVGHELAARERLRERKWVTLADELWRAWGTLRHARVLGEAELIVLVGEVRLGVGMGILPSVPVATLNRLLVLGREAHLAGAIGTSLGDEMLTVHRATLTRRLLEQELGQ